MQLLKYWKEAVMAATLVGIGFVVATQQGENDVQAKATAAEKAEPKAP